MFSKIFKTLIGLLLLPFAVGVGRSFYTQVATLSIFSGSLQILERGVLAYLLFHVLIIRPVYIYVLGHETVHVIANWLCGGKVVSFNVSPSGGSVVTSKTNFFIELSPYFIPFYTLILGLIYMLIKISGGSFSYMGEVSLFLIGVTLAFHFAMTAEVVKVKQPDIARSGFVFSAIIIFIGNLIVTIAVFTPIFSGISFVSFLKNSWTYSAHYYIVAYERLSAFVTTSGIV